MAYFTSLLLVALVLYLVVQPFFSKGKKWDTVEIKDDLDDATKEQLYATINELEMEYNMGKLPKEDFERMKKYYEIAVAQKIREEEALKEKEIEGKFTSFIDDDSVNLERDIEREIDEELAKLRRKRKGK